MDKRANRSRTTVRDQIDFHQSWACFLPIGKGFDRYQLSHAVEGLLLTPCAKRLRADLLEPTVNRCRAQAQESFSNRLIQAKMPVPLNGHNQGRQQRLESLAANSVGGFPQDDQSFTPPRLMGSLAHWVLLSRHLLATHNPDRVFAMVARYFHEFIQNCLLPSRSAAR